MHEILTVQLGQQANYLATHFWNTQESYFTYSDEPESVVDHDIHFRPGLAPDGTETFMPRTLIYDLKTSFGTLRKINALYDVTDETHPPQALWNGTPVVHHSSQPLDPSPYIASLDAGLTPPRLTPAQVRFFSDYSRVFYHPRSVIQVPELGLVLSKASSPSAAAASSSPAAVTTSPGPLDRFSAGEELFAALDRDENHGGGGELLDRDLRPFAEEADHMQGIQVFTGMDDAWGGFAARYVERMRDEFGTKTEVWVWGLHHGSGSRGLVSRETRLLRLTNKARALTEFYKHASIVVPLAVPDARELLLSSSSSSSSAAAPSKVQLDAASAWHTSALLAAAVESATLPSRLRNPLRRDTLGNMADLLNAMGKQRVAGLQMGFPSPPPPASASSNGAQDANTPRQPRRRKLTEEDLSEGIQLDIRFTPPDQLDPGFSSRRLNGFYGTSKPRVFSQLIAARGYDDEDLYEETEEVDELGRRVRRSSYEPVTKSYSTPLGFPLLSSFPGIFLTPNGEEIPFSEDSSSSASPASSSSSALAVTSSLSTDSSVSGRIKELRSTVLRSFGLDEREALGAELADMADEYHEGWSSGSDDGDDD
ncbi:hypothetical protein VTJ04DRAFT_729 [Mycothermus thermophilus]|uniref:uncharacterized protein n=1 Tax=Humicola insolens TaxID=85995 RepID=UPI003742FFDF